MLLASSLGTLRAQPNDEENAKNLIKELYSYSLASFEFAEFDKRLNLKAHCELLKRYFSEDLVKQPTLNSGCVLSHLLSVRYPSVRLDDSGQMRTSILLPKAEFSSAQISSYEVAVDVVTHRAKSVYFLKKVGQDLKIVDALIFEYWPIGNGTCRSGFLAVPSKDQKNIESADCLAQRSKQ